MTKDFLIKLFEECIYSGRSYHDILDKLYDYFSGNINLLKQIVIKIPYLLDDLCDRYPQIASDKEFIKNWLEKNPTAYKYLPTELKKDENFLSKEFVKTLVEKEPRMYAYLPGNLKEDKNFSNKIFIKRLLRKNPSIYTFLPRHMRQDPELFKMAFELSHDPDLVDYAAD